MNSFFFESEFYSRKESLFRINFSQLEKMFLFCNVVVVFLWEGLFFFCDGESSHLDGWGWGKSKVLGFEFGRKIFEGAVVAELEGGRVQLF